MKKVAEYVAGSPGCSGLDAVLATHSGFVRDRKVWSEKLRAWVVPTLEYAVVHRAVAAGLVRADRRAGRLALFPSSAAKPG